MEYLPYIIRSFRGGCSDEDSIGIKGSFKYGYGLDIHKRRDSLSCKQAMVTLGATADLIRFFVCGSDGTTYCFGDSGSIYSISDEHGLNLKGNATFGAIKGAGEWGINTGLSYLMWATATSVGRKLLPGDDAWGDITATWKTDLFGCKASQDVADTAINWNPFKRACGCMMVGNGNYLALIDYTGAWNPQAMFVEPGSYITSLESRKDYVIIGSEYKDESEEGYIWSWITTALNYIDKKKIPIKGVNALLDTEFMLLCGGSDGEIFLSDFANTEPQIAVPGGGIVNPGGVAIDNDLALFGLYSGTYPGLWGYGRRGRNRPVVLNQEYRLAQTVLGNTITQIGAVGANNGTVYASWKTAIAYGIDCVSTTTKATALYESLEFDAGSPHLRKHFKDIHLIIAPMPASTTVAVKVKLDKAASWTNLKTSEGATTFGVTDATECVFLLDGEAKILEVGVTLTPSVNNSPEVLAAIAYILKDMKSYA